MSNDALSVFWPGQAFRRGAERWRRLAGGTLAALQTEIHLRLFVRSLQGLALAFRLSKRLRREIDNPDTGAVFNGKLQFSTKDGRLHAFVVFDRGRVRAGRGLVAEPDVTVRYQDAETLARIYRKSPEDSLDHLLTNEMSYTGNMAYLTKFSYLTTLLSKSKRREAVGPNGRVGASVAGEGARTRTIHNEVLRRQVDEVRFVADPYLGSYCIDDFPRLAQLQQRRYALKPAICVERARLLTEFHRREGFETDRDGRPLDRHLRQARGLGHVLRHKRPIIWDQHLLAGSTTSKEVGVAVYPELIGTTIWPELSTISDRELNPNTLSAEDADVLNFEVFPFWMDRNVREHCRRRFGNPLSQQLEERFVLYFMMKNNAISHTVPDFEQVLQLGLRAVAKSARERAEAADGQARCVHQAMGIALEGVLQYAQNLAAEASRLAAACPEPIRASELEEMARICRKVPAEPADTLHEAVMSIWIAFCCLHAENADSALSIGRLDQLLQPLFLREMSAAEPGARPAVVERAIELVGSLFLKLNDHDPLVPNVGNKLFGGSSSDDTVTVGGVDEQGRNAVCDMTYVVLKAAEMLCFQDPNLNARYYPGVNSDHYLRRLCEVNINMRASPIIHNDRQVIDALVHQGIPIEDARRWAATGCVEPSIAGQHFGHTNCMLLNLVAPLEMALHDGVHPVMDEQIGPHTGDVAHAFPTFERFLAAYLAQLDFLIDQSIEINNYLGIAHQELHPTPLLSALFRGPQQTGRDVVDGGARYNSSGVALVSITDVVDSLMVIKQLVYEQGCLEFSALRAALEANFDDPPSQAVLARIRAVPKFGSGDAVATSIAQRLMDHIFERYQARENYRGGKYVPGYWSISYHVGFGMLSGALPSGRRRGKPFTPGLTPAPGSSATLLDNITSVAALDHRKMPNNIAFNVKLVPGAGDDHHKTLDAFTSYLQTYFDLGGMQWQFNVVSTEVLRDALAHPEQYPWLLVRISGYNAYFVKLNRNMQLELIERTEHCA